jgi:hypothetical protein
MTQSEGGASKLFKWIMTVIVMSHVLGAVILFILSALFTNVAHMEKCVQTEIRHSHLWMFPFDADEADNRLVQRSGTLTVYLLRHIIPEPIAYQTR